MAEGEDWPGAPQTGQKQGRRETITREKTGRKREEEPTEAQRSERPKGKTKGGKRRRPKLQAHACHCPGRHKYITLVAMQVLTWSMYVSKIAEMSMEFQQAQKGTAAQRGTAE